MRFATLLCKHKHSILAPRNIYDKYSFANRVRSGHTGMSDSLRENTQDTRSKKPKKGSVLIGVALAVAVLVLVTVVFVLLKTAKVVEPAALVVGDREVSKEQFDRYVELGKKTGVSEKAVKSIVIDYEKNKLMATKYSIVLPEAYVALSRDDMVAAAAQQAGNIDTLRTANDDFTQLRLYNTAFVNYLTQAAQGGWSIVLYDIPVIPSMDEAASIKRAHDAAVSLHDRLAAKEVAVPMAVTQAQQLNVGQPAQTGMYFIRESDGAVMGQYAGGIYTRLLDPDFIREQLRGKKPGLTEVKEYQKLSSFFIDLLYTQKKQDNFAATVAKEKTSVKVVDYVSQ